MHIESWDLAIAGRVEPAQPGLLRRVAASVLQGFTHTYELNEHLAKDVGQKSYEVPLVPARWTGRGYV